MSADLPPIIDPPGTAHTSEPTIETTLLHQPTPSHTGLSLVAVINTCTHSENKLCRYDVGGTGVKGVWLGGTRGSWECMGRTVGVAELAIPAGGREMNGVDME